MKRTTIVILVLYVLGAVQALDAAYHMRLRHDAQFSNAFAAAHIALWPGFVVYALGRFTARQYAAR